MPGWTRVLKPLAIVSGVTLSALGILGQKFAKARFAFKLTIYSSVLGLTSLWGVFVSLAATLTGQRFNINYFVARSFYGLCSPLVGIRIHVEGEEHLTALANARNGHGQSAILVGNHQSFLDILYLGRILPKRSSIMAKKELMWTPLLGQFMALSGAVMINRKDGAGAVKALAKAGEVMKARGVSLWVFPEGTRSSKPDPTLLPFKKGAFHLAVQAQVPIVPVVCENYWRLFDGRGKMEAGDLRLRVLPPIPTDGLTANDVNNLVETTREAMLSTLIEISEPGPAQLAADKGVHSPAEGAPEDTSRSEPSHPAPRPEGRNVASDKARATDTDHSTEDEMDDDAVLLKRPYAA